MINQKIWDRVDSLVKEYNASSPKPEKVFPPDLPIIDDVLEDKIVNIISLGEIDNYE